MLQILFSSCLHTLTFRNASLHFRMQIYEFAEFSNNVLCAQVLGQRIMWISKPWNVWFCANCFANKNRNDVCFWEDQFQFLHFLGCDCVEKLLMLFRAATESTSKKPNIQQNCAWFCHAISLWLRTNSNFLSLSRSLRIKNRITHAHSHNNPRVRHTKNIYAAHETKSKQTKLKKNQQKCQI